MATLKTLSASRQQPVNKWPQLLSDGTPDGRHKTAQEMTVKYWSSPYTHRNATCDVCGSTKVVRVNHLHCLRWCAKASCHAAVTAHINANQKAWGPEFTDPNDADMVS